MKKLNTVVINEIKYIIKNNSDLIENTLSRGFQWNNDILLLIGLLVKKYKLKHLVNVGSHIGTVVLPISKYIKKVTAFEPFPPTFQHFMEHIKLNKIQNVKSYNLALGDRETKVCFLDPNHERFKNNSGGMPAITDDDIKKNRLSSNFHSKKYQNTMKKIDNLPIEKFDIILIDAEGREYEIIKGGTERISKNKPIIIVEIWENQKRKFENMITTREDVISYIENLGYKLSKKINDNYVFFPENLKI
tara:strand:+ start:5566 stop:6306 length:741 start_codon:yes stop_codon:yes gene_type:complete